MQTKAKSEPRIRCFYQQFRSFAHAMFKLAPNVGCDESVECSPYSGHALLFTPVQGRCTSNYVFVPRLGKWVVTEPDSGRFKVFWVRYKMIEVTLANVPDGNDAYEFEMPVHTPLEVAEVLRFYFNAKRSCAVSNRIGLVSLASLIDRYYVRVWVDKKPRLLPLDDHRIFDKIPDELIKSLAAESCGETPNRTWDDYCKLHRRRLRELALPVTGHSELCWNGKKPQFSEFTGQARTADRFDPMFVVTISRKRTSAVFCREFFGYTTEGAQALLSGFKNWNSLDNLAKKIALAKVSVPVNWAAQLRWAIELRCTRDARLEHARKQADARIPFAKIISSHQKALQAGTK